jgi:uncharacterized protein DUF4129
MERRASATLAVLAVLILLGLVALAAHPAASGSGSALTAPPWLGVAADTILQAALMVLLVAAIAATVINVWAVLPLPKGTRRPRPLSASLAAYLYFGAALAILLLRAHLQPLNRLGPATAGRFLGTRQLVPPSAASGVTWIAALAALAVIVLAALLLLRWWRSLAGPPAAAPTPAGDDALAGDRLAAAIVDSIDALRAEPDPRRAVIAAYARLETELETIGRPRRLPEAPLEYMVRILAELRVDAGALRRLVDLFEWARFSDHLVDRRMKEEAIEALVGVRRGLQRA